MTNPVQRQTGAAAVARPALVLILLFLTLMFGVLISKGGLTTAILLILIPFVFLVVVRVLEVPKTALYLVLIIGFLANGLGRYIKDIPFGLSIDGLLVLCYVAIFFRDFHKRIDWSPASRDITLLAAIWFGYSVFQLVNPESLSKVAWFYAMRGVSLYMFLMIPLFLLLFDDHRDLKRVLYLWGIMSLLATFKGVIQQTIGPDPWEQAWLNGGGDITHILFGKLRVFSFYSDAGQFGASQAHTGVVASIIFLHSRKRNEKIFFFILALASFYGMFISGTRGAIAVPAAGFFVYIILIRNIKLVTLGIVLGISVFIFFKYTTIGNDVYAIRRMRTAFDPNDASLQVRLENQRKLKVYLASRPFGGGIGSAGNWGQRFSPQGFLANVPTDSWYVMIWAEQGIVGLVLHLFILFFILIKGSYQAMTKVKDPVLQGKLFALAAGMFGIMVASYGNGVLGQSPTGPLLYGSMAFLFLSERLQKSLDEEKKLLTQKEN
jgi:hypothetical protein